MITSIKPQFITNENGEKLSVILSLSDYESIMDELEELEDINLFDKAKKIDTGERIAMDEAFKMIESKRSQEK